MDNQVLKQQGLKQAVKTYWNKASCGTEYTAQEKFSQAYFQEIEALRYTVEPEIFSFAQFTRARGKKVLEVGVGAGTDFVQWVRAGAQAHGIDLTEEAIANVQHRLALEGLQAAEIQVADAEQLPYADATFDLVYSWGVIHHSPNTEQCLREIIRVLKPGGVGKVMIYHRYSLFAVYRYLLAALFKGKPFQSLSRVLFEHQESPGTKAYTFAEARELCAVHHDIVLKKITAPATSHDLLYYKSGFFRRLAYVAACLRGWNRSGWFLMLEFEKVK